MTYVIINGHRGLPAAVFEVSRETPKRYYGDLADTISDGSMRNWFWLSGLTKNREPGKSYVLKQIVACEIETLDEWHGIKDKLRLVREIYDKDRKAAEAVLNKARQVSYEREALALDAAERRVKRLLGSVS